MAQLAGTARRRDLDRLRRRRPAGFAELDPQPDGQVELAYFGLLRPFHGRGLGGHLLSVAAARAWDLADRWPGREATTRVWLHTCSLDGPAALPNYQSRGFRVYDTRVKTREVPHQPPAPGPAPADCSRPSPRPVERFTPASGSPRRCG
ncbi:GNAT family N-acetyltransferase [Actinomadura keratinilytica]|uniref:GNAT family N-acetyltransferase n=1 Tax=Actinomadura keratinilytica TaxID=547461 RepID=UPI003621C2E7